MNIFEHLKNDMEISKQDFFFKFQFKIRNSKFMYFLNVSKVKSILNFLKKEKKKSKNMQENLIIQLKKFSIKIILTN